MTSALNTVGSPIQLNVNPFMAEFSQNLSISNRNITKISKANFSSESERFASAQKNAQDRIRNINPADLNDEAKSESVEIESNTAIDELKSLINDENKFISKNVDTVKNQDKKETKKEDENKQSDINESGCIDFGKFLNRAQGIINTVAPATVKSETENTKSNEEQNDIKVDATESKTPLADYSILKEGEKSGKDLINNDKNKDSKVVEEKTIELRNMLKANIFAA